MMTRFDNFIRVILDHEGGYVNDPADPGGETNMGISKRAYPGEDIKNMTEGRAKEIYFRDYYKPLNLHYIPYDNLALHIFDMAVNAGPETAVMMLQRLLKGCTADGHIGPETAQMISHAANTVDIVEMYKAARYRHYYLASIKNPKWMRGWKHRIETT